MELDGGTRIAQMFKDRNNPDEFEPCTAKVIAVNPLKLKMQEKIFLIANDNLIVSDTIDKKLKSYTIATVTIKDESYDCKTKIEIKVNDSILVIPSKGTTWYAIDKVV